MNDLSHEEHLLDLTIGFSIAGAMAGGAVTVFAFLPRATLASLPSPTLPASFLLLTLFTCGVLLCGGAYLCRRASEGRLDERVTRALPLFFLVLSEMFAGWTRVIKAFPGWTEGAAAVSLAVAMILVLSVRTALSSRNEISRVIATANVLQYAALAVLLAIGLSTGRSASGAHLPRHRLVMLRGATVLK
jgi:hypothetical protein